jgi:hypothetical protein
MKAQIFLFVFGVGLVLFALSQLSGYKGTPEGDRLAMIGGSILVASMILGVGGLFFLAGKL